VWGWLKGDAFADHVPLNDWPVPSVDFLENYPLRDRLRYWDDAAAHFEQLGWLNRSAAYLELGSSQRASAMEAIRLSTEAAAILQSHPRMRVAVPLETDQIQFASSDNPQFIAPTTAGRLAALAPGIVSQAPLAHWPANLPPPGKWLQADLPGTAPYLGIGGSEIDARVLAWLAFLRGAELIRYDDALPQTTSINERTDANRAIWFYPGSWFGVDEPVPTLALKWLRRAEQDYEYLCLTRDRGDLATAMQMCRLLARPVELPPNEQDDPTAALLSENVDRQAWRDATTLLASRIIDHQSAASASAVQQWARSQEHPTLLARTTQWLTPAQASMESDAAVLRIGVDVYNASESRPVENTLRISSVPFGWERMRSITIPSLAPYRMQRVYLDAKLNPSRVMNSDHRPIELTFSSGFDNRATSAKVIVPCAVSDRLPPGLNLNGSLEDWSADDAIQEGPMVQMLNRIAVQNHQLLLAATPSSIYSGWSDENFYVAFKLAGKSPQNSQLTSNFVSYERRRAWGEDLCEILMQAMYADGSSGPVLHIVCKPNGNWVERKADPSRDTEIWTAVQGAPVRYFASVDGANWRGEVAIPWKLISDDGIGGKPRPVMLKFNFSQHRAQTGESASWAGPTDFGRDDGLMGLLFIRDISRMPVAGGDKK
jgi:hypothetical protein